MLLKRLAASAISISRGVKNAAPEKMKMAKFVGQTPRGPIHDGWALSRMPFNARNPYLFFAKAVIFISSAFWLPFFVVSFHLKKANR